MLVLEPHQVCPIGHQCKYNTVFPASVGAFDRCYGTNPNRKNIFVCNYFKEKEDARDQNELSSRTCGAEEEG